MAGVCARRRFIMDKRNIAHLIAVIDGWYESSTEAPAPPEPVVAFLRELVVGLQELPAGDTEVTAETLGNLLSCALVEMPGDWEQAGPQARRGAPPPSPPPHLTQATHDLDDFTLGEAIGWAWTAGLLYAVGYSGQLVHEGGIDRLALTILNSVPGLAVEDDPPPGLLEGLTKALDDARDNGVIHLSGDLVQ